jgi:hypothetical protein
MEYHIVKRVLTRWAYPLVRSRCYLDMFPKHGDIGGDGMDSLLECPMLGVLGFLLLRPIVMVLKTDATRNPQRGDIYPYRGVPGHAEA